MAGIVVAAAVVGDNGLHLVGIVDMMRESEELTPLLGVESLADGIFFDGRIFVEHR